MLPLLMKVPLAAVDVSEKDVKPPPEVLQQSLMPLLVKVPLPALEVPEKVVEPPSRFTMHVLPPLVKVPLPALELPEKVVEPGPSWSQVPPGLVKVVRLPAVALLVNDIKPLSSLKVPDTKFCVLPELFVIPTPLIVSALTPPTLMEYTLAPGL